MITEKTEHFKIPLPDDPDARFAIPMALRATDAMIWPYIEALQKRIDALEKAVTELQGKPRQ